MADQRVPDDASQANLATAASAEIRVGSRVRVRDGDGEVEFTIVEPADADVMQERVSTESPLGRALLRRRVGDVVRFRALAGALAVTVVDIDGIRAGDAS